MAKKSKKGKKGGKGKAGKKGKKEKKGGKKSSVKASKSSKKSSAKVSLPVLFPRSQPTPSPPPPPVPCQQDSCTYSHMPEPQYDPGPCVSDWEKLPDMQYASKGDKTFRDHSNDLTRDMKGLVSNILDEIAYGGTEQKSKKMFSEEESENQEYSSEDDSEDDLISELDEDKTLKRQDDVHITPTAIVPRKEILYHVNVLNDDGVLEVDCLNDIHPLPNCRLRELEIQKEFDDLLPIGYVEGTCSGIFFENDPEDF